MQTISLSKTEQVLISTIADWVEEQKQLATRTGIEKLSPILEQYELLGKPCSFVKQEDGSWVIQIPEEIVDAT